MSTGQQEVSAGVRFVLLCRTKPLLVQVKVATSDLRGAGTSANVYITLFGSAGDSGARCLESGAKNFERGRSDIFELVADVGELESIRIGHDNSGLSPNWHLKASHMRFWA